MWASYWQGRRKHQQDGIFFLSIPFEMHTRTNTHTHTHTHTYTQSQISGVSPSKLFHLAVHKCDRFASILADVVFTAFVQPKIHPSTPNTQTHKHSYKLTLSLTHTHTHNTQVAESGCKIQLTSKEKQAPGRCCVCVMGAHGRLQRGGGGFYPDAAVRHPSGISLSCRAHTGFVPKT